MSHSVDPRDLAEAFIDPTGSIPSSAYHTEHVDDAGSSFEHFIQVLAAVLIIFIFLTWMLSKQYSTNIQDMHGEMAQLQENMEELGETQALLRTAYNRKKADHEQLEATYQQLRATHEQEQAAYTQQKIDYTELKAAYEKQRIQKKTYEEEKVAHDQVKAAYEQAKMTDQRERAEWEKTDAAKEKTHKEVAIKNLYLQMLRQALERVDVAYREQIKLTAFTERDHEGKRIRVSHAETGIKEGEFVDPHFKFLCSQAVRDVSPWKAKK